MPTGWTSQVHPGSVHANVGYSSHINPQQSYLAGSVYKGADGSAKFNGGTLSKSNNPIAAFLGTAPGEIRADAELTREDYIRDMYEAYAGQSQRMRNIMITKITNMLAYPITEICPWKLAEGMEVAFETWKFEDEYLGETPEQGVSRVIRNQSMERRETLKRKGLAFMMEYGFYDTIKGEMCFWLNIEQISNAVIETFSHNVMYALANCELPREYAPRPSDSSATIEDKIAENLTFFAAFQKSPAGFTNVLEKAQKCMRDQAQGKHGNIAIMPEGSMFALQTVNIDVLGVNVHAPMRLTPQDWASSGVTLRESRGYACGDHERNDPLMRECSVGGFTHQTNRHLAAIPIMEYTTALMDIDVWAEPIDNYTPISYVENLGYTGIFEGWGETYGAPSGGRGGYGGSKDDHDLRLPHKRLNFNGMDANDLQNRDHFLKGTSFNGTTPAVAPATAGSGKRFIGDRASFDSDNEKPRYQLTTLGKKWLTRNYRSWAHMCERTGVFTGIVEGLCNPDKINLAKFKELVTGLYSEEAKDHVRSMEQVRQELAAIDNELKAAANDISTIASKHSQVSDNPNDERANSQRILYSLQLSQAVKRLTETIARGYKRLQETGKTPSSDSPLVRGTALVNAMVETGIHPDASLEEASHVTTDSSRTVSYSAQQLRQQLEQSPLILSENERTAEITPRYSSQSPVSSSDYSGSPATSLSPSWTRSFMADSPYGSFQSTPFVSSVQSTPHLLDTFINMSTDNSSYHESSSPEQKTPQWKQNKHQFGVTFNNIVKNTTPNFPGIFEYKSLVKFIDDIKVDDIKNESRQLSYYALAEAVHKLYSQNDTQQPTFQKLWEIVKNGDYDKFQYNAGFLTSAWNGDLVRVQNANVPIWTNPPAINLLLLRPEYYGLSKTSFGNDEYYIELKDPVSFLKVASRSHVFIYVDPSKPFDPSFIDNFPQGLSARAYGVYKGAAFSYIMSYLFCRFTSRDVFGPVALPFEDFKTIKATITKVIEACPFPNQDKSKILSLWAFFPVTTAQIGFTDLGERMSQIMLQIHASSLSDAASVTQKVAEWRNSITSTRAGTGKGPISVYWDQTQIANDMIGKTGKEVLDSYENYYKSIPSKAFDRTGANTTEVIKAIDLAHTDALTEYKRAKLSPDTFEDNARPLLIAYGDYASSVKGKAKFPKWTAAAYRFMLNYFDQLIILYKVEAKRTKDSTIPDYTPVLLRLVDETFHHVAFDTPASPDVVGFMGLTSVANDEYIRLNPDPSKPYVPPSLTNSDNTPTALTTKFYQFIKDAKKREYDTLQAARGPGPYVIAYSPAGFYATEDRGSDGIPRIEFKKKTIYERVMQLKDRERLSPAEISDILHQKATFDSYFFFKFLIDNNLPTPIGIINFRPSQRWKSYMFILVRGGGETGHCYYLKPNFMIANSAMVKTLYGHYTSYGKCIIENPQHVVRIPDVYCPKYLGGWSTSHWDASSAVHIEAHNHNPYKRDMYHMAVESNWKPMTSYVDITGRPVSYTKEIDADSEQLSYSSAEEYCERWGFEQNTSILNRTGDRHNTLCIQDFQRSKLRGDWLWTCSRGAWGDRIYPGSASTRRTGGCLLRNIDYNNTQPM